ncbi:guanine nucleotide-binding protein subunit gamma 2-like [Morus notabilis]|uniref:guanine nucleotide-binding protein subunit gamma 2-like n=1 Tax=Morus notabilis TaxID=981085 RepID=UPI000CED2699|nr:guanine nucleotide-binding protein subunit gamma 2-like [Morus notabilis]
MVVAMDEQHQHQHQLSKPSSSSSLSLSSPSIEIRGDEDLGERAKREEDEDQVILDSQERAKEKAKAHLTFLGRHRLSASISYLNNQINIIQEELNELETVGQSSILCKELLSSLENIPDPLLPMTKGPADVNWDRWFRGVHNSRGHKRWI